MTRFMDEVAESINGLRITLAQIHLSELQVKAEDVDRGQGEDAAKVFFVLIAKFRSAVDWI